jgi:extradiol dioxygenase family protein
MIKIKALHIAIPVLDVRKAVHFYRGVFGLVVHCESDDLCQLGFQQHRISLRRTRSGSVSLQKDADGGIRSRHFGFEVTLREDLERAAEQVVTHGGHIVLGPMKRGDGRAVFCLDPSGNQVEIYCSEKRIAEA